MSKGQQTVKGDLYALHQIMMVHQNIKKGLRWMDAMRQDHPSVAAFSINTSRVRSDAWTRILFPSNLLQERCCAPTT